MRSSGLLLTVLASILAWGVWRLFDLRFAGGDVYPVYSSLRTDPMGTRGLYEGLSALPGFDVRRNYKPFEKLATAKLPDGHPTLFYLGVSPHAFEGFSRQDLTPFETLANAGARVVIGFLPARREVAHPTAKNKPVSPSDEEAPFTAAWQVKFSYVARSEAEEHASTSLLFTHTGKDWHGISGSPAEGATLIERNFGSGAIVLAAQAHPLTNEALEQNRQPRLLAWMVGPGSHVIFDESHLGVRETGSVAGLARKYRLGPLVAALLIVAGLYLWRSSVSFLPPRAEGNEKNSGVAAGRDAGSGLANLLRRNLPQSNLIRTCFDVWERDRNVGRYSPERVGRAREESRRPGDAGVRYAEISRILTERNF